jgi:hypothetical protein
MTALQDWITRRLNSMWTRHIVIAAALLLASAPVEADAQGCCAFGSSLTPTRLDLHERALVGVQAGASWLHGSHTWSGAYRDAAAGSSDVELRQTLFATAALGRRIQASALVPWVETYRATASNSGEWGHGLGDISILARGEFTLLHEYPNVPSLALILGALFPTGTPQALSGPEDSFASSPLGTDATGGGVYRLLVGSGVEQAFGSWLVSVTGTVSIVPPGGASPIVPAPRWSFIAGAGYAWSHQFSTAAALLFEVEGNGERHGEVAIRTNRRRGEFALVATYNFDDTWRAQGRLGADPPISEWGANEAARLGANLALIWSVL